MWNENELDENEKIEQKEQLEEQEKSEERRKQREEEVDNFDWDEYDKRNSSELSEPSTPDENDSAEEHLEEETSDVKEETEDERRKRREEEVDNFDWEAYERRQSEEAESRVKEDDSKEEVEKKADIEETETLQAETEQQSSSDLDKQREMSENQGRESATSKRLEANPDVARNSDRPNDGIGKPENFKSKFDGDNFPKETSYDARATEETCCLVAKSVTPIREMGFDESAKAGVPDESYTKEEVQTLKAEREKIDAPNETTVMQKVIGVDTGNLKEDLKAYLDPRDRNTGAPKNADVYGFVAKAEDSAPFTKTPEDCYNNLRLDYDGTAYNDPNQSVYVMRFTDGTNYEVPYSKEFDGEKDREQPCTGNGYAGNEKNLIPEYEVQPENGKGAIVTEGKIYRVNPDGSEEAVAYYDEDAKCFKEYKKGEQA